MYFGKKYLIKNIGITQLFSGLGAASGLMVDAIILYYFGLGQKTDALFAALALPMIFVQIIQAPASKVLVPVFAKAFTAKGAENLFANCINTFFIVLSFLAFLGIAFAHIIIPIMVPGLHADPQMLAIRLCSILFFVVPLRGIVPIMCSALYTCHQYAVPASMKLIGNVITAIVLVLLFPKLSILAVAVGFIAGDVTNLFVLVYALSKNNIRYKFYCNFKDTNLHKIIRSFIYPVLGDMSRNIRVLLDNFLASFMGAGSLSVLRYANRIIASLIGVTIGSIGSVTLAPMSHHSASGNIKEMKSTLLKSIKLLLFISVFLLTWLFFSCEPLLILLFERGQFSRANAEVISVIIGIMAPGFCLGRINALTENSFYANFDLKTPLGFAIIFTIIYSVFVFPLVKFLGIYGFPTAYSLVVIVMTVVVSKSFQRKFGSLGWETLSDFGLRMIGVVTITAFVLMLTYGINNYMVTSTLAGKILALLIPTVSVSVSFVTASILLRVVPQDTVTQIIHKIRSFVQERVSSS